MTTLACYLIPLSCNHDNHYHYPVINDNFIVGTENGPIIVD
jgi:hypothetical protein